MNVLNLINEKRKLKGMAELTIRALLFYLIYYPLYAYTLVITFADVRFWILTAFGLVVGTIRLVRWMRMDDLNYDRKVLDNKEKEIEMMEREVIVMERKNKVLNFLK